MLKLFFRRAASPARARLTWLAAPWACAWIAGAAMAEPPRQAAADPFRYYQNWRDEPLQDWRAANARVDEIGGWRTYLREAQQAGGADEAGHGHGAPDTGETP